MVISIYKWMRIIVRQLMFLKPAVNIVCLMMLKINPANESSYQHKWLQFAYTFQDIILQAFLYFQ